jgi:protein TonB
MKNRHKKFLKRPEYPGGKEAFKKYIKENLKYPDEALQKQIEGIVQLVAQIDDNGNVVDVSIEKGLGAGCDEEAERLIRNVQFGGVKNRGVRLKTKKKFKIEFKLPPKRKISYSYNKSDSKKEKDSTEVSSTKQSNQKYSYTIKIKPA